MSPTNSTPWFVEVASPTGVWQTYIGSGSSWNNYHLARDLDLLLPCHDLGAPMLFANNGDGTLSDVSAVTPFILRMEGR